MEPDTVFPGGKFAAIGRYLLFRVGSASRTVRLVLDLTTSFLGDGEARLPPATIVGEEPVSVGLLGHGAARVISPPLSPLTVDGAAYVLLDLGAEPKLLEVPRPGLMGLYGAKVPIDPRRMVAFARQISLIDADAVVPVVGAGLRKFPADLANGSVEFSGIYEDGWLGDEGFVVLSSDRPGNVVFRGLFPQGLGLDAVDLTLTTQGGAPTVKHLQPGPFEFVLPAGKGRPRVDFKFSAIGRLPLGDNRPAAALLSAVFIEPDGTKSIDQAAAKDLPAVIQDVALDADGVFGDGWLARKCFIAIDSLRAGKVVLRGMVPGDIGLDDQEIAIASQLGDMVRSKLAAGPFEIEIPVQAGRSKLSMEFSRAANLQNGDGRSVAALLQSMTVVPRSE